MCIYVQSPLTEPVSYLVHPTPDGSETLGDSVVRSAGSASFYGYPYNKVDTPNGIYAVQTPHASDIPVAQDAVLLGSYKGGDEQDTAKGVIYKDQVFSVGSNTSGYSKTPEVAPYIAEYVKRGTAGDGGGHMFGYATCHWIKSCDPSTDRVGSPCQDYLQENGGTGVLYKGFCFQSDSGSLECGHLTAIDNEYGEKPISFDAAAGTSATTNSMISSASQSAVTRSVMPHQVDGGAMSGRSSTLTVVPSTPGASGTVYRCPTGSPAKGLGSFVSKRMLIAGCMIPTDAQYDFLAEVHVPAYCAVPADYNKGCLNPMATNFNPTAKQSGDCHFLTMGCISPTAVNYNSEASFQDPVNTCIEAVHGCTIQPSTYGPKPTAYGSTTVEVPDDTPKYKSLTYGSAYRNVGLVSEQVYNGPAVTNYNSDANVMQGCVVAVEGCMDPTKANYDSMATINTWSWCIPVVRGCMMPDANSVKPGYYDGVPHKMDAPNGNFSIMTTVHDPDMCVVGRYGCANNSRILPGRAQPVMGINYDASVTHETQCYWVVTGCLNEAALNYGCSDPVRVTPCLPNAYGPGDPEAQPDRVTVHLGTTCKYPWNLSPSPPAPPPPALPPGVDPNDPNVVFFNDIKTALVVSGDLSYFDDPSIQALTISAFKDPLGPAMADKNITLSATSQSVGLEFSYTTTDADEADALLSSIQSTYTDANDVQATMGNALGVQVLSNPVVSKQVRVVYRIVGPLFPETFGGTIGVVIATTIGTASAFMMMRKRAGSKATYPA